MKYFNLMIGLVAVAALLVSCTSSNQEHSEGKNEPSKAGAVEEIYTCPMHPSVRQNRPGACPVCGMALVKASAGYEMKDAALAAMEHVSLNPTKRVLANVATSVAKSVPLQKEITAYGKIEYAEPLYSHISMRFSGRLEKLYITYEGAKVKKGDPVLDVYSPEAVSAQQEFILALRSVEQSQGADTLLAQSARSLLAESRQKLLNWGFTEAQIADLEQSRKVKTVVTFYSPVSGTVLRKNVNVQHYATTGEDVYDVADLSTVWMYIDVYEFEIQWIKLGQRVEAVTDAYPGQTFRGKITFIDPTVNPATRTMRVRVEFPNKDERLKPEMYTTASIRISQPATVAVPSTAVLMTGRRTVVWVQVEDGVFEPRVVTVGSSDGTFTHILSGIKEGERVVSSGGYLIDSESQLLLPATSGHHGH